MGILKELTQIRELLKGALGYCDIILSTQQSNGDKLDFLLDTLDRAVIRLRVLVETHRPNRKELLHKPNNPVIPDAVGKIEVNEFGWVHIRLNTLLPNCRYKTPLWLENTLAALLLGYQEEHRLPRFERAMLIIEEHCDISNRQVYDQDNKGWKAIPNAIKGLLVDDDDQFTLELALLSRRSEVPCCHIWILPADEAGEYFSIRGGSYGYTFSGFEPW